MALSKLVPQVVAALRERGENVSFAESCSGGLLSAYFTEMPGVSDVYLGSIVAYSYPVKIALLGVSASLLNTLGAVSLPVAREMAVGAHDRLHSDWAVSITGIAGPGGGSAEKPVGTVCFGVRGPGVEKVYQRVFDSDRRSIQEASCQFALAILLDELGDQEGAGLKS